MNRESIFESIKKILIEEFEIEENLINNKANLYEEIGLDSLDSIDFIVALENEFSFKVDRIKDESFLKEMRNLDDVCNYIINKLT